MARARNLKPSFFMNEELAALGSDAMVTFAGLWCHADREGRIEDRPARIKAQVLPYHTQMMLGPITTETATSLPVDVNAILSALYKSGFIHRYQVNGKKYIQIINFSKHQNPHVKESASTIPAPDLSSASIGNSGTSPALTLFPLPSSLNPITTLADKSAYSEEFEQIWNLYPKRTGDNPKKPAYQCFNARLKTDSIQDIEAGVIRYARYCEATDKSGTEFVMQAKRFFGTSKPYLNDWKVNHGANKKLDNSARARVERATEGAIRRNR